MLNGVTTVIYGRCRTTRPERRTHALNVFYTLTIGSSALSPPLSGLVGDLIEISGAVIVVAMLTLATVPLAFALRKGKGSAL